MIYLDNAATSFPKPEEVYLEIERIMRTQGSNPGRSGHKGAIEAGSVIFEARENISKLIKIEDPLRIAFTLNATEALNTAIKGFLKKGDHVVTTSMEHNSVLRPIKALENIGVSSTIVQCSEYGELDPKKIEKAVRKNTKLIAVTHASNVTGTIMPITEIGIIAKKTGVCFLVDAAQTAGSYDVKVKENNIELLAMAGHKGLLGPQGTGVLYIAEGVEVKQLKEGGTGSRSEDLFQPKFMPDKYESGTLNTLGIAGLSKGVEYILNKGIKNIRDHEESLAEHFILELEKNKKVKIYGLRKRMKHSAVVSINIGDEDSAEISYILDKVYNIATRAGLHCAPLAHKTIGTFKQGTVRFSFGVFNTHEEVEKVIRAIKEITSQL
ncbi:MAG: aminotransferase class V-fold PLP-dependent enzyme [Clostridiales bacterium]|nr:aminotransferase class V-fold PLP-dependent enzyme [Clostridiales bacterium]